MFYPGRDTGYQNGDSEPQRWSETSGERWGSSGGRASGGGSSRESRDIRRDEDFNRDEPPQPRNDRWKEPEPRTDERSNSSRWPSDDVRRGSNRRDDGGHESNSVSPNLYYLLGRLRHHT